MLYTHSRNVTTLLYIPFDITPNLSLYTAVYCSIKDLSRRHQAICILRGGEIVRIAAFSRLLSYIRVRTICASRLYCLYTREKVEGVSNRIDQCTNPNFLDPSSSRVCVWRDNDVQFLVLRCVNTGIRLCLIKTKFFFPNGYIFVVDIPPFHFLSEKDTENIFDLYTITF